MALKRGSSLAKIAEHKHSLIPSVAGGGIAYLMSGAVLLGLAVFAAVWVGSMLSHKKK